MAIDDFNINESKGKIEEYVIGNEIGKGSYAIVKLCIHKKTGKKYAIKIYEKSKLNDSAKKSTVKREIQILKKLNNIYTIKLYDVIDEAKYVYLRLITIDISSNGVCYWCFFIKLFKIIPR
jgi:serine/threonine protein kinase